MNSCDCEDIDLSYKPVPPKHTFTVKVEYVFEGKGKPHPFSLLERK